MVKKAAEQKPTPKEKRKPTEATFGSNLLPDNEVLKANAKEYEDEFKNFYAEGKASIGIIEPPFNPCVLEKMAFHSNSLGPCVDAMVTNIDGTGHDIQRLNKEEEDNGDDVEQEEDKAINYLNTFFNQPWPGFSFKTLRKKFRRDMEVVGWGCFEVIRNAANQIVFLRHVEAKTLRLVRLGDTIDTPIKVKRGDDDMILRVGMRYRRFVQKMNYTNDGLIYFKEFGCPLDLDKTTGEFSAPVERDGELFSILPMDKRATEIIYLQVNRDINTPYGVPRWISQTPSILGSRQAEEYNLSFFEGGGVPPFMIIVHGGVLATRAQNAIEKGLSSKGTKHRGFVVEAESSGGSLTESGNVKVTVERFGAERQNDSMFEAYDANCEKRVRRSFRLPPIFVGDAESYNYATAFASYVVGEAQVFKPERDEFDEMVNLQLIPALLAGTDDIADISFRSLPITVHDVEQKLAAIEIAATKNAIGKSEIIRVLNEVSGLEMKQISDDEYDSIMQENQKQNPFGNIGGIDPKTGKPTNPMDKLKGGFQDGSGGNEKPLTKKMEIETDGIIILAQEVFKQMVLKEFDTESYQRNMEIVGTFNKTQMKLFQAHLSSELYDEMVAEETNDFTLATLRAMQNSQGTFANG